MKQKPGSRNCVAVVAAMITGTTVEEFENSPLTKLNKDGGYNDSSAYRYLLSKGYVMGATWENLGRWKLSIGNALTIEFSIAGCHAYVGVKSRNYKGYTHAIYWDGVSVHDPDPKVKDGLPLSDYDIIDWKPIYKLIDPENWEKEHTNSGNKSTSEVLSFNVKQKEK